MRLVGTILHAATINPRGGGTVHEQRRHDWGTVVERVARMAGGLQRKGVTEGDRVALAALNSDRFLECLFAISWAGAIVLPINLRLSEREMADQLEDAQCRFLIADEAGLQAMQGVMRQAGLLDRCIQIGSDGEGEASYDALLSGAACAEPSTRADDAAAILFYTGGTTGRAKGVPLSHRNLFSGALGQAAFSSMTCDDRSLHGLPMFHVGAVSGMLTGTLGGGYHHFLPRFEERAWMKTVAEERITRASLASTMLKRILEHPDRAGFDLSSLRRLHYGAAAMPVALLREVMRVMPEVGLYQGYGQTEASGTIAVLDRRYHVLEGPHAGKLASAGQIVPGVELSIRDGQGAPLPAGQTGEICLRGDCVMRGYWRRPQESADAFFGAWLRTGDAGRIDEDGFLFLADRMKDIVISGGENIFSAEVEAALYRHPAIAECAVIGLPDAQWGERVHAVVVLREGAEATEAELVAHCGALLARYKCPKSISFSPTPLPVSAVGKILKRELRVALGGSTGGH